MTASEQIWASDVRSDDPEWGPPWPPGWSVRHVASTGSTNTDLLAAAAHGAPHRAVLAAAHQTAGRGRLDRRWEAPPGANLLVSLLFRPGHHGYPDRPAELVQRVALAAAVACGRVAEVDVRLKWPNDLLLDGAKLAGILSQRASGGEVAVGLGLNVGWCPDGAARLLGGPGAPAGGESERALGPADVLRVLLEAFDELPADVAPLYRSRLDTLGRRVHVTLPDGEIDGRAIDVLADGRLVVLDSCGATHRLDVGDVVHVRPAPPT